MKFCAVHEEVEEDEQLEEEESPQEVGNNDSKFSISILSVSLAFLTWVLQLCRLAAVGSEQSATCLDTRTARRWRAQTTIIGGLLHLPNWSAFVFVAFNRLCVHACVCRQVVCWPSSRVQPVHHGQQGPPRALPHARTAILHLH